MCSINRYDEMDQTMRDEARLFQRIFEQNSEGIIIFSADWHLIRVNDAVSKMFGYGRQELSRMTWPELVHSEDLEADLAVFNAMRNGEMDECSSEKRFIRKDGGILYANITVCADRQPGSDEVLRFLAMIHDITEQKCFEKLLDRKSSERRLLLDTLPLQAWYLTDPETYGAVNTAHADFLGYHPRELAYRKLAEFSSPAPAEASRSGNRKVFETGEPLYTEEWMPNAEGEQRLLAITRTPRLGPDGKVEWVVCSGVDITDQRGDELKLKKSEARFRHIFNLAPMGIELYDKEGCLQVANPACVEIFGVENQADIHGFQLFRDPNVDESMKQQLRRGEMVQYQVPFDFDKVQAARLYQTWKTGIIHLHVIITPVKEPEEAAPGGYLVLVNDITDRISAERQIRDSEERLRMITENTGSMIAVLDNRGIYEYANSAHRTLGYEPVELAGVSGFDLIYPEDVEKLAEILRKGTRGELSTVTGEYRVKHKDGRIITLEGTFDSIRSGEGHLKKIVVVADNITERKIAEEQLKLFKAIVQNSREAIAVSDSDGRLVYINPAHEELFGRSLNDARMLNYRDYYPSESIEFLDRIVAPAVRSGKSWEGVLDAYDVNGRVFPLWERTGSILDDEGRMIYGFGFMHDDTERRQAEEALRESQEKFRILFEYSPQPMALTEIETGDIVDVNHTLCRLTGYSKKELSGSPVTGFGGYSKKVRDRFLERLAQDGEVHEMKLDFTTKRGSVLNTRVYAVPVRIQGKACALITFFDVTQINQMESHLREARKMEAIGTLAGGVAHEFNNALAAVMGNVELLEIQMADHGDYHDYFSTIKKSGLRMTRLTRQLLAYARGGKYRAGLLRLDEFVVQSLPILKHLIKKSVKVETDLHKGVCPIEGDPTQIQMVLSAIMANSDESMAEGGTIRILVQETGVDRISGERHPEMTPGPHVCLTVTDTGIGMSDEEKTRIFDPFFTTKFQGRGMGMAAAYGIVRNHGGLISVDSRPGGGTRVMICFPALKGFGPVSGETAP